MNWRYTRLWVVAMLGLCACGPPRGALNKAVQNERGVKFLNKNDTARARGWFEKAASEANHTVAGGQNGVSIAERFGIRLDLLQRANPEVDWTKLESGQTVLIPGDPAAQFSLGVMYEKGQGELPKDQAQSLLWILKSGVQGFTDAEFMTGRFYQKGWGAKRSPQKAVEWY